MKRKIGLVAAATAALVVLAGCSTTPAPAEESADGQNITLWLMGGDTPDALRDYLKTEYADATGGTLTIEQQDWSDALSKLTTALPDAENTPDVTEIGNTWSPTFTTVGAFSDITDMYDELGGSKLLQSFVDVGAVDGRDADRRPDAGADLGAPPLDPDPILWTYDLEDEVWASPALTLSGAPGGTAILAGSQSRRKAASTRSRTRRLASRCASKISGPT